MVLLLLYSYLCFHQSLLEMKTDFLVFEPLQPSSEFSELVYLLGSLEIHLIDADNDYHYKLTY